ncbi:MAG: hypothetical protein ACRCW2_03705 [Cellulosilyticaceae bacterium]
MKDTVILLINDYKLFIGDFYQGKIKQVKFKKQDYWEVFDTSDLREFLEYMIYPLNYKKFKGSEVRIYFNRPLMYNYLYEVQGDFKLAEGMHVGGLEQLIIEVVQAHQDYQEGVVFECLEKRYCLDQYGVLVEEEEEEAVIHLTIEALCEYITMQESINKSLEEAFSHYIWFSPVTLKSELGVKGKYKYLEVENKYLQIIQESTLIEKDDVLLTYEQIIYKLFGKKEIVTRYQKAPQSGKFVQIGDTIEERMIKKDQLLGVIAPVTEERSKTLEWLKDIIKY